jgi:hypothetical protein
MSRWSELKSLRATFYGAVALTATLLASAVAQQNLVTRIILASVTDRGGRATVDVEANDFVVEEGNNERDVLDVHVADYPVAVLLDDSSDNAATLTAIQSALARFITRIGQRPIAVGTLADPVQFVATFDDERAQVLDRLASVKPATGQTLLPFSAVVRAGEMIRESESPFSVVVLVSSRPVDASDLPDAERLSPILESGTAVHVVALRNDPSPDAGKFDLLRTLADQTRGSYVPIYSPASLSVALDRLADRLSTEIMIGYATPSVDGNARVGIRIPGARVTGLGISK